MTSLYLILIALKALPVDDWICKSIMTSLALSSTAKLCDRAVLA